MRRLALLCLALVFWSVASRAALSDDGLKLSVLTYNIRFDNPADGENRWEKRKDAVVALIKDHDPDLIGLQEALSGQLEALNDALPRYARLGVGRDDGKAKGEFSAILYRADRFKMEDSGTFWLSDTPEVPGSNTWGAACVRICTWAHLVERSSGRAVNIFNVHLDHQSQSARERSVALLLRRAIPASEDGPLVITGDFNAGETNPAIAAIKASETGLVDTFRAAHPDEKDAGTFNEFGRTKPAEKIDYIWVQKAASVKAAGIDRRDTNGRFPSDHFAVWAEVVLPAKAEP